MGAFPPRIGRGALPFPLPGSAHLLVASRLVQAPLVPQVESALSRTPRQGLPLLAR